MTEVQSTEMVGPYKGDPFAGHLATPISASGFTKAFIGNLPAYRPGVSPLVRGLEVGMAHGYFLLGPWVLLGPLRDYPDAANLGGLVSAIAMVLLATAAMSAYGLVTFPKDNSNAVYLQGPNDTPEDLKTGRGWSQYTAGFFVGGMGGAFVAFFLLENFSSVDAIFRGLVN
ncbi:MAG: photosystem I reaction center protein subunit XI [Spirulinaceae cyanobacterium RM2_2_10]|nr:photosystem I reaction center protein subunit XI [Spirulinaceae cyanobacterium SM2_1_0]NJO19505.1 photosystem I reaction center protein subunit XI [Spirulinaceae cyanobacterium RM2_2_10]